MQGEFVNAECDGSAGICICGNRDCRSKCFPQLLRWMWQRWRMFPLLYAVD